MRGEGGPGAWYALEFVFAVRCELQARSCREVGDRARNENLVRTSECADALRNHDCDARYIRPSEFDLAGVQPRT